MIRIDEQTVEYTDAERALVDRFEDRLSDGLNIKEAARYVLDNYAHGPTINAEFIAYLSDDMLRLVGGQIIDNDCNLCHKGGAPVVITRGMRILRYCTSCSRTLALASSKSNNQRTMSLTDHTDAIMTRIKDGGQ